MLRWLILLLIAIAAAPAAAQQRGIDPQLVAEGPAPPGGEVELAIHMRTRPGWHGYWLNPGDAGLPMSFDWQLPPGFEVGELRYPVPTRLTIAGLMNYVYKDDYAVLVRLKVPEGAKGSVPIRASANWLACTDEICVPESGSFALNMPVGTGAATERRRFDEWRRALPRPLVTPARFELAGDRLRLAIPLPRDVALGEPYVFPAADGLVEYAGKQSFRRSGDVLVAELPRRHGKPQRIAGVLALGDGRGLEFTALPGDVPEGGRRIGRLGGDAILWAVLGAIAGGILLNLMPCVFPILALKALHLARSGGEAAHARRDALAYTAGAVVGTGALGAILLAIRAAGSAAGWAFQLQDPRTILFLMLLAVAITLNLLGLFRVPVVAGDTRPSGGFATGALAALVATPCAGPFLGAALGTALLLPAAGSVLVFAALGLGLAIPFLAIGFVPALRRRLPAPGPWMVRLQRFLAIPMAATAVAALWLLYRQGGDRGAADRARRCRFACAGAGHCRLGAAAGAGGRICRDRRGGRSRCRGGAAGSGAAGGDRAGAGRGRALERSARSGASRAGAAGVRLFHRRLVPELQGQRGHVDRPIAGAPGFRRGGGEGARWRLDQWRPGDHSLHRGAGPRGRAAAPLVRAGAGAGGAAADPDAGNAGEAGAVLRDAASTSLSGSSGRAGRVKSRPFILRRD
jgi:DsbC/DsbD-like thiol-disulfide interchange protein/cytochrome c biogenesis protein CcdA